jgi:hypothetical protein
VVLPVWDAMSDSTESDSALELGGACDVDSRHRRNSDSSDVLVLRRWAVVVLEVLVRAAVAIGKAREMQRAARERKAAKSGAQASRRVSFVLTRAPLLNSFV